MATRENILMLILTQVLNREAQVTITVQQETHLMMKEYSVIHCNTCVESVCHHARSETWQDFTINKGKETIEVLRQVNFTMLHYRKRL